MDASVATRSRGARIAVPAVLLLGLLLFAFRGPLSGRLFYLRDIVQNHDPVRHLVTERLARFELPLWNPYQGGGTPLLADPNTLALHPISALFLVLPFDAAFTASIVLQYVLLLGGGYLLARALGSRRESAALAAAILALSGPAASLASMHNVLSAAAWVAPGAWALYRGLKTGRTGWLVLASCCLAVVLMTAEPASLLAFALLAIVVAGEQEGASGSRAGMTRPVAARLGAVLMLALLLGAIQILPARDLLGVAARAEGFTAAEGLRWSLQPERLAETIVPRLFGDPTHLSPQAFWGRALFDGGVPFFLSLYLGVIPAGLLLYGALHRGGASRRRRILAVAVTLALLLALGRHSALVRWLYDTVAPLRQMRYPERFVLTALFPAALLAAAGLDRLLERRLPRPAVVRVFVGVAAAAFAGASIVAAAPGVVDRLLAALASVPDGFMHTDTGAEVRGAILMSFLWVFAEAAILAAAAALLSGAASRQWAGRPGPAHDDAGPGAGRHDDAGPRTDRFAAAAAWGLVAVSGLSMTIAAAPALSSAAAGWLRAPSPLATLFERGPGAPRLHHDPRPESLSVWGTTDELIWGYRFDRFSYALATGHPEGIPTIFDPATDRMDLADHVRVQRALSGLGLEDKIKVLARCRAGYLLSHEALQSERLETGPVLAGFSLPPLRVYRVRDIVPRVRFAAEARVAHRDDPLSGLADRDYDPARAVLLQDPPPPTRVARSGARELPAGLSPGAGSGPAASMDGATVGATGDAKILDETPERIRIAVRATGSGWVVLADAWAPGWRATVDGRRQPVLKADGLFRAVAVDAGEHVVEMRYRPGSVRAGMMLSLAGLVAACAWMVAGRRRPGSSGTGS